MKHFSRKIQNIISSILHFIVYCFILLLVVFSAFAVYVKVYTLDVSFLINYLKQEHFIDKDAYVGKLALEYDNSFILSAKNVSLKNQYVDLSLVQADIEIAKTSFIKLHPSIKKISVDTAKLYFNLDKINQQRATEGAEDRSSANFSVFKVLRLTKYAEIENSELSFTFNNQLQVLNNINITFDKENDALNFTTKGKYEVLHSIAPFVLKLSIPNKSKQLDLDLTMSELKTQDLIKSLLNTDSFSINGTAKVNIHGSLNKNNKLSNIFGSVLLEDGFVKIKDLYKKDLDFKSVKSNFAYNIESKKISFDKGVLVDNNNNIFDVFGDFSYLSEPSLNITAKTKAIDLLQAFNYVPDLDFKDWTNEHILAGDATNVVFGYYGPFRPEFDGENGNPYFDIHADVDNLKVTYLENLPAVENGKAKFSMIRKNIDIEVESATTSQQQISRGSVNISPLFEEKLPYITIKSFSDGPVEDVLNVVNKKLNLNQEELFSKFSGVQETQATIKLNLNNFDNEKNIGTDEEKFITVDVLTDIPEVVGVEPAFKQRFEATDATLVITEEDFKLDASGFMNENPFSIVLQEKLLEFGDHTKVNLTSNLDSYLLKEYLDIPSFNLSGLIDSSIQLEKSNNMWTFNLNANIENSLINFGLLNYTKPFGQKGTIKASGVHNLNNRVLNLKNIDINTANFKVSGSSKININDIEKSKVNLKNIIINDKTDIEEFTLDNNLITIKGKSLDLRPLTMFNKANKKDKSKSTDSKNKNDDAIEKISIKLDKLYLNDDKGVVDVSVLLNFTNQITGLIKLKDNPNAQSLYIKLTPVDDFTVRLESIIPNVGTALRKSDVSDDINNGFGVLYGDLLYNPEGNFQRAELKLNVRKFQLLEAPLLAKALATLSLEQLFTNKKGILFDDLYSEIYYENDIVKIKKTKVSGPSLGIALKGLYDLQTNTVDIDGTLIPVVKLNQVLGTIPILGYILTGSQGAISGADFKVYTDKKGETAVSVSPLSVVTPGIVKDIFSTVGSLIPGVDNNGSKIIEEAREKANK